MSKLSFHQGAIPGQQVVKLDGKSISDQVRSISITAKPGELPTVVLDLLVFEIESDLEEGVSQIQVTQGTADLLQRYGWTPPPSGYVVRKLYTTEELKQSNGQEGQ